MRDLAVLIPSYNDTPALLKTLASIVEEDNSFMVVIVDDGSRAPVEIDRAQFHFSVHVIRQPENKGIVEALNTGLKWIRESGFKLVARLDAADLNRPNRFRIQYQYLHAHPEISMVGSNVVFLDEDTDTPIFTTTLPITPSETKRWITFRNCFIHPTVMLRTDVLDLSGLYDSNYKHIEDYVLFSRIVENASAANLPEVLVDCYVRQDGISLKNQRSQLIAGLKFKLKHPRPFDPLWYAFLLKRTAYLFIPPRMRNPIKHWLGFAKKTATDSTKPTQGKPSQTHS